MLAVCSKKEKKKQTRVLDFSYQCLCLLKRRVYFQRHPTVIGIFTFVSRKIGQAYIWIRMHTICVPIESGCQTGYRLRSNKSGLLCIAAIQGSGGGWDIIFIGVRSVEVDVYGRGWSSAVFCPHYVTIWNWSTCSATYKAFRKPLVKNYKNYY